MSSKFQRVVAEKAAASAPERASLRPELREEDPRARAAARAAQLEFKIQVQEWKNTLLRGHDPEARAKYLAAVDKEAKIVAESDGGTWKLNPRDNREAIAGAIGLTFFLLARESVRRAYDRLARMVAEG
mgnify:CR=1 FL=1